MERGARGNGASNSYLVIYEPKEESDSALSVMVGPIEKEGLGYDVMSTLVVQAGFELQPRFGRAGAISGPGDPLVPAQRKQRFVLPRESMKHDLILAAKQLKRSCWGLERAGVERDGKPFFFLTCANNYETLPKPTR